jgi:hypothetical protein
LDGFGFSTYLVENALNTALLFSAKVFLGRVSGPIKSGESPILRLSILTFPYAPCVGLDDMEKTRVKDWNRLEKWVTRLPAELSKTLDGDYSKGFLVLVCFRQFNRTMPPYSDYHLIDIDWVRPTYIQVVLPLLNQRSLSASIANA